MDVLISVLAVLALIAVAALAWVTHRAMDFARVRCEKAEALASKLSDVVCLSGSHDLQIQRISHEVNGPAARAFAETVRGASLNGYRVPEEIPIEPGEFRSPSREVQE